MSFFGGQQSQNQANTGFGGGQGGGLFGGGGQQTSAFGGGASNPGGGGLFGGGNTQPGGQTTGGMFGGASSSGFGGGFGGGAGGAFGGGANAGQSTMGFNAGGNTGGGAFGGAGFGAQNNQPQNTTSAFGGNTGGLFGKPNTGGMFGNTPQTGAASLPFQGGATTAGFGNTTQGMFGGATGGFGAQNQNQAPGQFGVQPQPQQQQQNGNKFYQKQPQGPQLVSCNMGPFQLKQIEQKDEGKGTTTNLRFRNIRAEDKFALASVHMLRLYDQFARQGNTNEQNPEFKACTEWSQKQGQYCLMQKIQNQGGAGMPAGMNSSQGFNNQGTSLFGGANTQQTTGAFGAPNNTTSPFGGLGATSAFSTLGANNNNAGGGLFGSNPGNTGGAFGNNNTNTTSPFGGANNNQGGGGLFGAGNTNPPGPGTGGGSLFNAGAAQPNTSFHTNTGGGLFGNSNNNATQGMGASAFGGGFGNNAGGLGLNKQPATGGGLFSGGNAATGGGLFNNANNNQTANNTGGLFSGSQTNTQQLNNTGGLFGNNNQTQNPATGGLFSSNTAQQNTAGGLFSQPKQEPAGGLFGGGASTQGGGLFGQPNKPAQTGGLFSNNTSNPTGGLFANNQQTGGLFGDKQNQGAPSGLGGGLFGQPSKPPGEFSQQPGGLFGQQSQQQPSSAAGGGLFGQPAGGGGLFSQPQKPAGGGLFSGGAMQPPSTGGGLFNSKPTGGLFSGGGQTTGNPLFAQPQQPGLTPGAQPNNYLFPAANGQNTMGMVDPFALNQADPMGFESGLLSKPLQNFDEEIQQIQKEAKLIRQENENRDSVFKNDLWTPGQDNYIQSYNQQYIVAPMQTEADHEEEMRYLAKQEIKQRGFFKMQQQSAKHNRSALQSGYQVSSSLAPQNIPSIISVQQPQNEPARAFAPPSGLLQRQQSELLQKRQESYKAPMGYVSDIVNVTAILGEDEAGTNDKRVYTLKIHKSRDTNDLWNKFSQFMMRDFQIGMDKIKLINGSSILPRDQTLEKAGIRQDCELKIMTTLVRKIKVQECSSQNFNDQESQQVQKAPSAAQIPQRPPQEYYTEPSYETLCEMSLEQLRAVPSFSIFNKFGRIKFHVPTGQKGLDLTEVDLKVFKIEAGEVEGYMTPGVVKPEVGTKLNVKSTITLNDMKPEANQTPQEKEQQLRMDLNDCLAENGDIETETAEHISYDYTTWQWEFSVPHYSRWGARRNVQRVPVQAQLQQSITSQINSATGRPQFEQSSFLQQREPEAVPKPLRYGSKAHQQEDTGMILSQKSQDELSMVSESQTVGPLGTSNQRRRKELLASIKKKKQIIEDANKSVYKRPTDVKTVEALKKEGIQLNATNSMRGVRPCFRPVQAGQAQQLLSIQSSYEPKKSMGDTSTKQNFKLHTLPHKRSFTNLKDVLLKHISISVPNAQNSDSQMANEQENDHENMEMDDEYQAQVSFDLFVQQKNEPTDIYKFLHDAAGCYVEAIKSGMYNNDQLNSEFVTICLLNALFGDPRYHLTQLHPSLSKNGLTQLQREKQIYGGTTFSDIKQSGETQKQRKNATIEVLKLLNNLQAADHSKPQNDDDMYKIVYQKLLNGDIKTAVRILQRSDKHNLAQCICQAGTGQSSIKQRIRQQMAPGQQKQYCEKIVELVTSKAVDIDKLARDFKKNGVKWHQALTCFLMYVNEPTYTLFDVIDSFKACYDLAVDANGYESLMFCLIKLYRGEESLGQPHGGYKLSAARHLETFQGLTLYGNKGPEPLVRWLVQYVIRLYSLYEVRRDFDDKIDTVKSKAYDNSCQLLVDQMVCQNKLEEALVICQLIQNDIVRKSLTFKCMGLLCNQMKTESYQKKLQTQTFVREELKLSDHYARIAVAFQCHNDFDSDQALQTWLQIDGYAKQAHNVFIENLAVQYFGTPSQIKELKKTFAYKKVRSSTQRQYLDHILGSLREHLSKEADWEYKGGLFLAVLSFMDQHEEISSDPARYQPANEYKYLLSELRKLSNQVKQAFRFLSKNQPNVHIILKSLSTLILNYELQIRAQLLKCSNDVSVKEIKQDLLINDASLENCRQGGMIEEVQRAVQENVRGVIGVFDN